MARLRKRFLLNRLNLFNRFLDSLFSSYFEVFKKYLNGVIRVFQNELYLFLDFERPNRSCVLFFDNSSVPNK